MRLWGYLLAVVLSFTFAVRPALAAPPLPALAPSFAQAWAEAEQDDDPERAIEEANRRHSYHVRRSVDEYRQYFGKDFPQAIAALGARDHLVDMGSGEGYFAEAMATRGADAPRVTGVTLRMERRIPVHPRLRYVVRDFRELEDRDILGEAGKASVITDVFGIFSYYKDASGLLERYFGMLREGGAIFLFYSDERTRVRLPDGKNVSMTEFLESRWVRGLKVTRSKGEWLSVPAVRLERTSEELRIPKLELVESRPHPDRNDPPLRYYVVK